MAKLCYLFDLEGRVGLRGEWMVGRRGRREAGRQGGREGGGREEDPPLQFLTTTSARMKT
jgi:hypothetical protein